MDKIQGNVVEYLETMPESLLDTLYQSPASCLVLIKYFLVNTTLARVLQTDHIPINIHNHTDE
jgi:hypothetical protein